LTPRKKKKNFLNGKQKIQICKLKNIWNKSQNKLKSLSKFEATSSFKKLQQNLNAAGVNFIRSQFIHCKRKINTWAPAHKAFALAIYKRGSRCYRFISKILKLPSKWTLQKGLKNVPFHFGVLLDRLSKVISKKNRINRFCTLSFDDVALSADLTYCGASDLIMGYEDLGTLGRTKEMAKNALVFMVQGLRKSWK
jgi:hypothetical protein